MDPVQAREIGLAPRAFLGAGAGFTHPDFAKETAISNVDMTSTQWSEDVSWPGAKGFYDRYKARFGKEPTYHAACAYESMRVLAQTAAAAGGDRDKTRDGLRGGKWSGIMGDVKFEDYAGFSNQNNHQMLVLQIQNGAFETVYPPAFSTKKAIYPFPGWK